MATKKYLGMAVKAITPERYSINRDSIVKLSAADLRHVTRCEALVGHSTYLRIEYDGKYCQNINMHSKCYKSFKDGDAVEPSSVRVFQVVDTTTNKEYTQCYCTKVKEK